MYFILFWEINQEKLIYKASCISGKRWGPWSTNLTWFTLVNWSKHVVHAVTVLLHFVLKACNQCPTLKAVEWRVKLICKIQTDGFDWRKQSIRRICKCITQWGSLPLFTGSCLNKEFLERITFNCVQYFIVLITSHRIDLYLLRHNRSLIHQQTLSKTVKSIILHAL